MARFIQETAAPFEERHSPQEESNPTTILEAFPTSPASTDFGC